jgi:hypothetical protein
MATPPTSSTPLVKSGPQPTNWLPSRNDAFPFYDARATIDTVEGDILEDMPMKRGLATTVFCLLIGLFQIMVPLALAQQSRPPVGPGAGHGFLIDKHAAAGLACNKCHTQSIAKAPDVPTCLTCHGGTYDKLAAITAQSQPNPHASHRGEAACAECHHVHKVSVTLCNQCHTYDMTTP